MDFKYLLKIFFIDLIILSIIIFIKSIGINIADLQNEPEVPKKLLHVVTIEGLENPLKTNISQAFCSSKKGFELEKACNNLTNYNCNLTSCCVWNSDNKCKAGNVNGPTFNSNSNGKTKPDPGLWPHWMV